MCGGGGLDVMNSVNNKSAITIEDADAFTEFMIDLLRCAEWECLLSVGAAAPEHEVLAETFLEH